MKPLTKMGLANGATIQPSRMSICVLLLPISLPISRRSSADLQPYIVDRPARSKERTSRERSSFVRAWVPGSISVGMA